MKDWFSVDTEGLKALQKGKPKTFIVRELVQNAFDEKIKVCKLNIIQFKDKITAVVEDDSPEGFKNLRDAYTLFGDTAKRRNLNQRGRFNIGEKQLIALCNKAMIKTTKGTISFTESGRHEIEDKTEKGTIVTIEIDGTEQEAEEMLNYAKTLLVPKYIFFEVNGEVIRYREPVKTFEVSLLTEIQEEDNFLKRVTRKTKVNLVTEAETRLYEMGIPVMDIDCDYSIDVQQKVPLSFDRDSVNETFMRELYAETLNNVYEDVKEENSSAGWIRTAMMSKRIIKDAVDTILNKRFGDKFCVANPFDRNSIDEAISKGYKVITGREMSSEEWANVKQFDAMQSSSDLFGTNFTNAEVVEPDEKQKQTADYARRIAKRFLGFDIAVRFVKGGENMVAAQYGNRTMTFNVSQCGKDFFKEPISVRTSSIVIHELGHSAGQHTENSYHELLTKLGAELIMLALKEPKFFEVRK